MFEYVCIFTTGGVVLWYKAFCELKQFELLNMFIKNILLEDKQSTRTQYNFQDCVLKWRVQNDMNLVFAIIYKEILQLAFVEDLLDMIRYEFVTKIYSTLPKTGPVYMSLPGFDQNFNAIMNHWEQKSNKLSGPKVMKTFSETNKAKKTKGGQAAALTNSGVQRSSTV